MIQKIKSQRVELPPIFLIEDEEDFKQLPKGLPYIIGKQSELQFITVFLEFQVLYKSCLKTLIPIKWLDCLKSIGYKNVKTYELRSGGEYTSSSSEGSTVLKIDDFVESQYFVDFDKLSDLKILPVWLEDLKASIQTNIIDEVTFDPTAFNKQLGLSVGSSAVKHNLKNLLILDVSGSIPNSIVISITNLAKLMSKKFYADIIVTGGRSYFIDYEDVFATDVVEIARKAGRSNEGDMFKTIVEQVKHYGTVICFGDDDSPSGYLNSGGLNPGFTVETLYSLHTESKKGKLAGYCKCLKPKQTIQVKDWINSIQK